jgi:hypothetical protein
MKKLLVTCTALLVLVGLGVTSSFAQICFDFNPYCDGLELSVSGGTISGYWRNTDCAGTDVPMGGKVKGGSGYAICDYPANPCPVSHDWAFVIDAPLDGTMDMYSNTGSGWTLWIGNLLYDWYTGPCLFAPSQPAPGAHATWMSQEQNDY